MNKVSAFTFILVLMCSGLAMAQTPAVPATTPSQPSGVNTPVLPTSTPGNVSANATPPANTTTATPPRTSSNSDWWVRLAQGGLVFFTMLGTLGLQVLLLGRRLSGWDNFSYRLFGLTLVLFSAIFVVVISAGQGEMQLAPIIGLLGTAIGYILGKEAPVGSGPSVQVGITPSQASIFAGSSATLSAVLQDATGKSISVPNTALAWSSSNPAVATVDAQGNVTAVSKGEATITVKHAETGTTSTATVTVT